MSTDPHDKGAEGARRNEVKRSEPINEQFAAYVQSTSFSLSLGRTHVRALCRLAVKDSMWQYTSGQVAPSALHGLERRGLVTHHRHEGDPPPFGDDAQVWELTTAGKLTVLLLVEAGLVPPGLMTQFPPPPPGWTDPRPKIKPVQLGGGSIEWLVEPSDREQAAASSPETSDSRS